MNKIVKRILSIFMALVLVIGLMPTMSTKLSAAPTIGDEVAGGHKVKFLYDNASAATVFVAGDFNSFASDSAAWEMQKNGDGIWELEKEISNGVYGYKFVVDGSWINDPTNKTYYPGGGNNKLVVPGAVTSPVVSGDSVTFNYPVSQVPIDATSVVIKGGFIGWAEAPMTLSEDGLYYTYTATGLAADTYEYGINIYQPNPVQSNPDIATFYKDFLNMEAVSNGGNSIFVIQDSGNNPAEDPSVQSPVVSGHSVTFKLYAPGATSVYVAGTMTTPTWNGGMAVMTYDGDTGYWSVTLNDVASGDHEYKFVKNGNWITDPLNSSVKNTNSAFNIAADVISPVVSGNSVTFNFKPVSDTYTSVVVAGTVTTWDLTTAPAMIKDTETGVYSYTVSNLAAGIYEYKFVGNPESVTPSWMTDPACKKTSNGNSAFVISGLQAKTDLSVKKGNTLELPQKLTHYNSDGTTTSENVTYTVNDGSTATINVSNNLVVPAGFAGTKVELKATMADGTTNTLVTVSVVDKVYDVTMYFYYGRNENPTVEDSDIYIFENEGSKNTVLEFSDTYTDSDGNVWLKGSVSLAYNEIGAIGRLTKGSWDGGQDDNKYYTLVNEDTTLWYEFGKELTETQPTIQTNDGFDGIKVHFLTPWDGANIYYWGATPTGAVADTSWPGEAMTSEGDGWFGYEFAGVDALSLIFNYDGSQTDNLSRTTGEWWYANDTWFDHAPSADELNSGEEPTEEPTTEDTTGTIKIWFYSPWDGANLYYWGAADLDAVEWPGVEMKDEGNGWYSYELKATEVNLIFNYDGEQTGDLSITAGEFWYVGDSWYETQNEAKEAVKELYGEEDESSTSEEESIDATTSADDSTEEDTKKADDTNASEDITTTSSNTGASVNTGDVLPVALLVIMLTSAVAVVAVSKKKEKQN